MWGKDTKYAKQRVLREEPSDCFLVSMVLSHCYESEPTMNPPRNEPQDELTRYPLLTALRERVRAALAWE
jgi:hypothetical protein